VGLPTIEGESNFSGPQMTAKLLYTSRMDRVRFGRALGFGARQAVKTLVSAVDAATAENPSTRSEKTGGKVGEGGAAQRQRVESAPVSVRPATPAAPDTAAQKAARAAAARAQQAQEKTREVQKGLERGSRRFGEAVWRPFVRLSGVLWLEVSGVFFGIFALLALGYVWKLRGAWHAGAANAASQRSLMGAVIMLVLFGYFCVSSFVRARRKERRR
jgi:hypothetical protein